MMVLWLSALVVVSMPRKRGLGFEVDVMMVVKDEYL